MKRSRTRQINIGIGMALGLLVANAAVSYRNILRLMANERWVRHTQEVMTNLEQTLSTVKDAETGQRGYLLTGDEQFLEPYNAALALVDQEVQNLQQLTADNPRQQERLRVLERSIDLRLANLEEVIALYRTEGFSPAQQAVQNGRGKQLMDDIRRQIAALEAEEARLLEQRSQESQASARQTLLTFSIASGLNLLLLALTGYLVQQDRFERDRERSKQNQLLDQLQASETQFKAAFDQAAVGIAQVSIDGKWQLVNQRLCDIVGYSQEELLEKTFQDITYPEDLSSDLELIHSILTNKIQTYTLEKRYIRKNETLVWINLTVSLVRHPDGKPNYFVSVVQDISDRVRIEAERKEAEAEIRQLTATLERRVEERTLQLKEVNAELEGFAYSVAHDLRAPLRGMQGLSEALLEDYGDRLDDIGREYAQQIVKSAEQLEGLIQDLLSYSRLSRTNLHLQPVDLDSVVAEAIAQATVNFNSQPVPITVRSPLPCAIAHRTTLIQVITNLITNALKFVNEHQPQVHIWAEELREADALCSELTRPKVRLWVEDNGIGIAPEHHKRIFRVFERLHGIESYPGTGIGLAIVQKGVERMGGEVGVESQLKQGSQFWITLHLGNC